MKSKEQNWYFYSDSESSQSWYAVYLHLVSNLTTNFRLQQADILAHQKWAAVFKVRSEIWDFSKAMKWGDRTHVQAPISASTPISDHNIVSHMPPLLMPCVAPMHRTASVQDTTEKSCRNSQGQLCPNTGGLGPCECKEEGRGLQCIKPKLLALTSACNSWFSWVLNSFKKLARKLCILGRIGAKRVYWTLFFVCFK